MIMQTIDVLFNIHSTEASSITDVIADLTVEQHELNYLKDHMGDCVDQAVFQYGDGTIGCSQLRQVYSLHYTITNVSTYQDAQELEEMLTNLTKSLLSEIGATE